MKGPVNPPHYYRYTVNNFKENEMSTFMAKEGEVTRKWYVLDAAGIPMGRVAAKAAVLLRGKHKTIFTPNVDCGDNVIIINCGKAVLTGKKLEQKYFQRHTGWIGGLKSIQYKTLMATKPEKAMRLAVEGMLPNGKLAAKQALHLHVYAGAEHKNAAQKPEILEV